MRSLPGARLGLLIALASTAACSDDDPSAPPGDDADLWSFSQQLEISIPGIEQTCSDRGTWSFTQNGTALSGEISYLGTCAIPLAGGACVNDDCIEPGPRRFDDFDFLLLRDGTTADRAVRFAAATRQLFCRYEGTLTGDPPTSAAGSIGCFGDEATTTALATGTWEASRGTPRPLPLSTVGAVTAASEHSCALAAGRAYCWGGNLDGELGIGDVVGRPLPTPVLVERSFSTISAGALHTAPSTRRERHTAGVRLARVSSATAAARPTSSSLASASSAVNRSRYRAGSRSAPSAPDSGTRAALRPAGPPTVGVPTATDSSATERPRVGRTRRR
jgi:Regulator of chromosome condensation (RCC1) repeat